MPGTYTDLRSLKMTNRKRRGKKPGTKWSRKMEREGMLMGERNYAPVAADDRWGERNRAAQAEREAKARAAQEQAERERQQAAEEEEQFRAQAHELQEQVRDIDFESPLPRRDTLLIMDDPSAVSKPLAGCSAIMLSVLLVLLAGLLVYWVLSFFV